MRQVPQLQLPDQHAVIVHHGQGEQLVTDGDVGGFLLIRSGRNADHLRVHDLADALIGRRQQQVLERADPDQPMRGIPDVDVIEVAQVILALANVLHRLPARVMVPHRDEVRGHHAAGGIAGVRQEHADFGLLLQR